MNDETASVSSSAERTLIAPVWHTVVLLAVFVALTILGWLAQRHAHRNALNSVPPSRLVPLQVQAIVFELAILAWVWFGVRRKGVRIRELVGGRWPNARSVGTDILLGGGLWVFWIAISRAVNFFFGHHADTIPYPSNLLEGVLAIAVAVSAGICEEIVFRGYLLRQFRAMVGSATTAVFLQAAVFGLPHVYQGFRVAMMAAAYGVLFAALALWRGSLRPSIVAHAWSDIAARFYRI
jgi:uncharacterized protein